MYIHICIDTVYIYCVYTTYVSYPHPHYFTYHSQNVHRYIIPYNHALLLLVLSHQNFNVTLKVSCFQHRPCSSPSLGPELFQIWDEISPAIKVT